MPTDDQPGNDNHGLDPQVEAWWVEILDGTDPGRHPSQPRIKASLVGETLTVSGAVASDRELQEVERDARQCCGDAVPHIRFDVHIEPESDGRRGLLRQVLWASFDNCEQATVAAEHLRQSLPDAVAELAVLADSTEVRSSRIPASYAADVESCLGEGKAVLVIEADEMDTFRVQETLDQDTRSLQTTVIPPVAPSPDNSDSRAT